MIIFGTRGIGRQIGSGSFNCPRCVPSQPYSHKSVRRYFTLYFIPLIPLGAAGDYVECGACAGTFGRDVLNYNPELERADLAVSYRQMLVFMLVHLNRCRSDELTVLQEVLAEIFLIEVSADLIANDARHASQSDVTLDAYLKRAVGKLNDDGRQGLLALLRRILVRVSPLDEAEKNKFYEVGSAIGVPKRYIGQILDGLME